MTDEVHDSLTQSDKTVHQYALGALATGVLPSLMPGGFALDAAGVFAVQMLLLKKLADGYGFTFTEDWVKQTVGSLMGALVAAKLGFGGVGVGMAMALDYIPVVGSVLRIGIAPGFNYLSTVAVGRVFERHFSSGGTLLSFDREAMKAQVVREYDAAKAALFTTKRAAMKKLRTENEELKLQIERLRAEMTLPEKTAKSPVKA